MTRTIIAVAKRCWKALFSFLLVAYLGQHSPLSLGLAVDPFGGFLAAHFPTRSRVERRLEEQARLLSHERQFEWLV